MTGTREKDCKVSEVRVFLQGSSSVIGEMEVPPNLPQWHPRPPRSDVSALRLRPRDPCGASGNSAHITDSMATRVETQIP
ncbi:hypothetical protein SKAU_G00220120 [Synaphobranchus kaupii]|uniref:Uncharacterized protein n=1 Tax=Synaphobranchus kaupii TaxID=118154 RepID=A0A9Q1FAS5_SYNKA|nr:hypothetical protein SKAU_G00220120 [Synaphobranchus kaupii]